ncbi:acyl-CoA dehydrogenase C-terminal domain-containing protein, partial [Microbacterium sp.]|uniref:acyl-CoA dehydrogenase C-terminal domain-containing protein n=1 Tax=Microbacterium sp. TaxID=51671 RepID=UPI003C71C6DE
ATASARRATAEIVRFAGSPRDAYAVSVPYLELLGVLAGGWMHALAVIAVAAHADPVAADAERLTLADFYGAHHLPRVHALAETVASGETL